MILTGTLLLSGFALIAVESVGYTRGGYDSAFWRLSLYEKLDHAVFKATELGLLTAEDDRA